MVMVGKFIFVKKAQNLLIIGLVLTTLFYLFQRPELLKVGGWDLCVFWAKMHALLRGLNPYSVETPVDLLQSLPSWATGNAIHLHQLPISFTPLILFGLLPWEVTRICWMMISISLVLLSCQLTFLTIQKTYALELKSSRLYFLFVLTFYPLYWHLFVGQITTILLSSICAFIYFEKIKLDQKHPFLKSLLILLTLVKIHLIGPFFVFAAIALLLNPAARFIFLITGFSFIALPLAFRSTLIQDYFTFEIFRSTWVMQPIIGMKLAILYPEGICIYALYLV